MTTQVTKEQAVKVLHEITAIHAGAVYFKKAEVVSHDIGFGVDLVVDREKWEAAKRQDWSLVAVPARKDRVPVCVLLVG